MKSPILHYLYRISLRQHLMTCGAKQLYKKIQVQEYLVINGREQYFFFPLHLL